MKQVHSSSERAQLARRQAQLVDRIFCLKENQSKGLAIYQNNLRFTAARALSISYPVLEKLLGQETMVALAQSLLQQESPNSGDWADWGGQLAEFIGNTEFIQDHPYVDDIARLEWKLHELGRQRSSTLERDSLALLESHDLENVHIELNPDIDIYHSALPVDQIWLAHDAIENASALDETALAEAFRQYPGECFLLLYRRQYKPDLLRLNEDTFYWFQDIKQGLNLEQLLDRHPEFDFVHWLAKAVENNWIHRLKPAHSL
ncbi:putative DNA-binding domain-containing protein [Pseudoteredinibacter isoporae]|uniref:Putative DNA-binding domain-containing protein n=1 Tax=Pseudoteredinibacter isoporae TaxID=570281 RepID=A0A7X0JVM9_9GAMM|nr:putative DNA-binding domain-containing protein [Pseudoteredinibacter isoporae]MBB6522251.1 hypothetical protein [Pseudoteredinibacter isoporae]NHO87785.1 DUF2063 domain-containing protein [Pseudoteredinibacter isoporae]NIB23884.1 DUF2063 domain-containing protein [Pseudoteredinibacter isoporae]